MSVAVQAILVPQGAEYQAVCRGLKGRMIPIVPLPVGGSVAKSLKQWHQQNPLSDGSHVLLMGVCGSLSPNYKAGQIVLYQHCINEHDVDLISTQPVAPSIAPSITQPVVQPDRPLSHPLSELILSKLSAASIQQFVFPVTALTVDRFIHIASEKRHLGQLHQADVVDMEGAVVLETLNSLKISVAMLRVISDDCHHDMPDLSSAVDANGSLQAFPLAIAMLQKPVAATRLIRGSLNALRVLENVTSTLFSNKI